MRELSETLKFRVMMLILIAACWTLWPRQCHAQDANHVVRIRVAEGGGAFSCGSGTLIGKTEQGHGVILTCWHLYRDSDGPTYIDFPTGERRQATLIKKTQADDLALLIIADPPSDGTPLSEGNLDRGEAATIAGYGGQGQYLAQRGKVVSYACFDGRSSEARVVTVQARQGDSGGPIFDSDGNVAGVISCAGPGETLGTCGLRVRWFVQSCGPYGCPRGMVIVRPRPTVPIPNARPRQQPPLNQGTQAPAPDFNLNPQLQPVNPSARTADIVALKKAVESLEAKIAANACKCDKPAEPKADGQACKCGDHKDCTCDPEKIAAAVMAKIKLPTPEIPKPQTVRHIVVVANQQSESWPRLKEEIERAQKSYSGIRVAPLPSYPIGTVPQAVMYENRAPVKVVKGSHDVEELLSKARRGEL